jgi:hypothetical protein
LKPRSPSSRSADDECGATKAKSRHMG